MDFDVGENSRQLIPHPQILVVVAANLYHLLVEPVWPYIVAVKAANNGRAAEDTTSVPDTNR